MVTAKSRKKIVFGGVVSHESASLPVFLRPTGVASLSFSGSARGGARRKPHSSGRVAFSGAAERKPVPEGVTASASEGHVQSSAGVDTVGCHGTDTFGKMMALLVVTSMGLKISFGSTTRSRPSSGLYRTTTTSPEDRSSAWTTLAASWPGARHPGGMDHVWLGRRIGRRCERSNTRTPYSPGARGRAEEGQLT